MKKLEAGSTFKLIRKVIRRIPKGQVTTYGTVATAVNLKDTRIVGWALHSNNDPKTPCHRVVNIEGRLAANYAFGGDQEQKFRLLAEGVSFLNNHQVNLTKHYWSGK